MEGAAAGLDDHGHALDLDPLGRRLASGASQSSGAWKLSRSGGAFGHRCEPRTYSIVPPWAKVSSSATQQVIISGGDR